MPSEPERDGFLDDADAAALARALRAAEASIERLAGERLVAQETAAAALARAQAAELRAAAAEARVVGLRPSAWNLVSRAAATLWRAFRPRSAVPPAPTPAGPSSPPPLVQFARRLTPRAFRVLFVTPERGFVSHGPRVAHYASYLEGVGIETHIVDLRELERALPRVPLWDVVVGFRLQDSPLVKRLFDACRRAGVVLVYDVDDLVFDPAAMGAGHVDALRGLPPAALADAVEQPARFLEALRAADACTVTTTALAEACRAIGRKAIVLPNGLDPLAAPAASRITRAEVWLGYASGTRTHQRDFAVIAAPLASVLARHRHARLRIIGELEFREFPDLDAVALQIEHRPLVRPDELAAELARIDVAIAPLEIGNPFCEAKSALKWLEAAAVGVPTVASATRSFADVIRDGETGFLARTPEDWERLLDRLVTDDSLRVRVGAAARTAAQREYGPAQLGARVRDAYANLVAARRGEDDTLTVTLALEPLVAFGAVSRRVLRLADAFAARGHEVRLAICGGTAATDESFVALRDDGILSRMRFAGTIDDLACSDVLLAATPRAVAAIAARPRRAALRVALGVDAPADVLVLPWQPAAACDNGLPLFLDHQRWSGDPARDGRDWLVCVLPGRADGPIAELALATMENLVPGAGEASYSLVLVGAPHDRKPRLKAPHLDLGWQPTRELALVFRRAAAGLVLRDPFDTTTGLAMLASGCPVVALDGPGARALYAGAEQVILVPPDSAEVAGGARSLLGEAADVTAARAAADQRWARALPGPEDAAAVLETRLRAALGARVSAGA